MKNYILISMLICLLGCSKDEFDKNDAKVYSWDRLRISMKVTPLFRIKLTD